MGAEGDRPKGSSWQRWLSRSQPEPATTTSGEVPEDEDLDLTLEWPEGTEPGAAGDGSDAAAADGADADDLAEDDDAFAPGDEAVDELDEAGGDATGGGDADGGEELELDVEELDEPRYETANDPFDEAIDEAFGPIHDADDADDDALDDELLAEGFDDDPFLDEPAGDAGEGGGALAIPTMSGRLDSVQSTVHALGLRLEALVGATSLLRNSVADRIDDYSATVSRLSLTQARDLDEYRRANERAIAELRRASAETDESLRRIEARMDELSNDIADLAEHVRRTRPGGGGPAAGSTVAVAGVERLESRLDELASSLAAIGAQPASRRGAAAKGKAAPAVAAATTTDGAALAELRDLVVAILDGMPASAEGSAADPAAAIAAVAADVKALRRDVARLARGATPAAPAASLDADDLVRRFVAALSNEYDVEITDGPAPAPAPAPEPAGEPARPARRRRDR